MTTTTVDTEHVGPKYIALTREQYYAQTAIEPEHHRRRYRKLRFCTSCGETHALTGSSLCVFCQAFYDR